MTKKVLHITYDMQIGGTEMVIKSLITSKLSDVYDMSIFCIESPIGPWGKQLETENGISVSSYSRQPGFDWGLMSAIKGHINSHGIDIVHCHQYTPWVYGVLAALFTSAKVIFTEHGRFYPDSSSWKRRFVNPLLRMFTNEITAISDATRGALEEFEFLNKDAIKLIYNGIDPLRDNMSVTEKNALKASLGINENTTVLGSISRFDPIKNHSMMLDAFAKVKQDIDDIVLLLIGDGNERSNIENKISTLGLGDSVILTGYKPSPENYLAIMDVFLLSSLSEGTSMTLLESMSLKKPCIVTDVGGNPEIVLDNYNGFVTPNDDSDAFGNAIIKLLTESDHVRFGANGYHRFFEAFSADIMAEQYQSLYESL